MCILLINLSPRSFYLFSILTACPLYDLVLQDNMFGSSLSKQCITLNSELNLTDRCTYKNSHVLLIINFRLQDLLFSYSQPPQVFTKAS